MGRVNKNKAQDAQAGIAQGLTPFKRSSNFRVSRMQFDMMTLRKLMGTKGDSLSIGFYITLRGFEEVIDALRKYGQSLGPRVKQFTIQYGSKLRALVIANVKASFASQSTLSGDIRNRQGGGGRWKPLNKDYANWKMGKQTTRRQRDRGEVSGKDLYHKRTAGLWRQGNKVLKVTDTRTSKYWGREQVKKVVMPGSRKRMTQEHAARAKMKKAGKKAKGGSGGPIGVLTGDMYKALTSAKSFGARGKADVVEHRIGKHATGKTWGMFWGIDARKIPHFLTFTKGRKGGARSKKKRATGPQVARKVTFYTKRVIDEWYFDMVNKLNVDMQKTFESKKGFYGTADKHAYGAAEVKQSIGLRQVQQKLAAPSGMGPGDYEVGLE